MQLRLGVRRPGLLDKSAQVRASSRVEAAPRTSIRLAPMLICLGLAALYIPMFLDFGRKFWLNEEDSHSGVLLLGILWAYYRERHGFVERADRTDFIVGCAAVSLGLAIYVVGRLALFFQLQGISLPIVVFGLTLASVGRAGARRWMLLNVLLVFTIPMLGPLADTLLVPLRLAVTSMAAHIVSLLGYPVATSGVMVMIGFVELNIAGACVGLRSMISILAIGLLFLHYFPMRSLRSALIFMALLAPIALLANLLRVVVLIIVAGQFGAVGEMGIHDFAAYAEIGVAIGLFLLLARTLERDQAS